MNQSTYVHLENHLDTTIHTDTSTSNSIVLHLGMCDPTSTVLFMSKQQAVKIATALLSATGDGLAARCELLLEACRKVRYELAALVDDPNNPDWMPSLGAENPADARCLQLAYDAAISAIEDCTSLAESAEAATQ